MRRCSLRIDLQLNALISSIAFFMIFMDNAVSADDTTGNIPVIREHPLDVIVAKGEPATLNCAAEGPDIRYTWFKDGEPVITNKEEVNSHRLVLHTGALFLLRVSNGKGKDADSGTYYCSAKNKYGEARSREASLKIAMLRDDFRIRPRPVQAVIGNRAVLECSPPRGFPDPVVSWKKDDVDLRPQDENGIVLHPSGNLIIEKVRRSDAGFYQCVATNMVGEKVSNSARLSVYEKPYFLQKPHNITVEVGSSVLFDCRVSGDPVPSISWKKRNQPMPVGRAYIAPDNRGLRIDKVQSNDEGEYICQAKNPAGSIETSAQLIVHAAPSFTKTPLNVSVDSGSVAKFKCEADGQPTPALFWSREGQQDVFFPGHISSDGRIKVTADGELSVIDVRPADEGNYVCAAMNLAGSSLTKATLKVVTKTLPSSPPPIIERGHSNQTVMIGTTAILPCQASGRSAPRISWLKNGKLIDLDDAMSYGRIRQSPTGTLQISDSKKSDTGVYTCRARNDEGETTWTASLVVGERTNFSVMPDISALPSSPGKPLFQNVTEDSVDLEWAVPEKSGATAVKGYLLQYFSPEMGETWFNFPDYISNFRYRVRGLKPDHSYVFIIRAENSRGIGPPSAMSDIVRTKPPKEEHERKVANANQDLDIARQRIASEQLIKLDEVRPVNATAVRLNWKRRKMEPLIEGYYIKWRAITSASSSSSDGSNSGSDTRWVNVSKADIDSYVVTGLKPFTNYEFFVVPYHKSVQGMPSNSLNEVTLEAPPTSVPSDVRVRMMNLTTLRISWRPPPADGINGVLRGFQIIVLGNGAKYNRNITTNERAASVTLFRLVPGMTYGVKVAARSSAGVGEYHGFEAVTMNEATLREHNQLISGLSGSDRLLHIIKRPWFIATAGVVIWIIFISLITFVWWRWRKFKGKEAARLGMPFIKINDGSVHLTARDALWMDHSNLNSTQRSLLLNSAVNGGVHYNRPPVYTQTPQQSDFYMDGQVLHRDTSSHVIAGSDRPHSPHHYHYAALTGGTTGMSTFYGGHQIMDDPSPYATTTLVMNSQQRWLKDHMLRAPMPPSNPVPSGPPPRFQDNLKHATLNDRRSPSVRSPPFVEAKMRTIGHHSGSPPHTDISYVQSSDGTGGSSNGRSKAGTLSGRRSPPKQILMDMIPPPPPGAPPPESQIGRMKTMTDSTESQLMDVNEHYDAVSDALLFERQTLYAHEAPCSTNNRPNSRSRIRDYRNGMSSGGGGQDDDDSQRSSLMLDVNARSAFCSSSEADEENTDDEDDDNCIRRRSSGRAERPQSPEYAAHRPSQPCMGVSASALTQSSYDGTSAVRSSSRLKSIPRTCKKDLV